MSNIAIHVENLGKQYKIGGLQEPYMTIRDAIARTVTEPFRRAYNLFRGETYGATGLNEEIWALKNISFQVKHGEVVGIIGKNGAGKSTLLKILSRITEPTEGYADSYGRIGSLLEVGTGFHPELTGRENIYLNGAILGMGRKEIDHKFDEIVDFSGIEQFIDTPVKYFSSGMGLRLGFAIAAYLEPDILIVDEVLAVGDAQFQRKCLTKMNDTASDGRTVLFVSHNMGAIQNLCQRSIWLNRGNIIADGETNKVVTDYLNSTVSNSINHHYENIEDAPGNDRIRVRSANIVLVNGNANQHITMVTPIRLEIEYWNLKPNTFLNLSLHFYSADGTMVFNTVPVHDREWLTRPYPQGLFKSVCKVPGHLLNSGTYKVSVLFVEDQARVIWRLDEAIVFDVAEAPEVRGEINWFGRWPGVVHPRCEWETINLDTI